MEFPEVWSASPRLFIVSVVLILAWCTLLVPVDGEETSDDAEDVTKLQEYLIQYGYVNDWSAYPDYKSGLKSFQAFANLNVSGVLDTATIRQMNLPRCHLRDPQFMFRKRGSISYSGTTWKKNVLTWRYDKETTDLDKETVRMTIKAAMQKWSDVTNIEFKESTDNDVDIVINFEQTEHNDPFPFDGVGGVFGHAYHPLDNKGLSGDIHFDDAEMFTLNVDDRNGIDLMWVVMHEIGHSLGLVHTNVANAIMYPFYQGYQKGITLQSSDVKGIQFLYGEKPST